MPKTKDNLLMFVLSKKKKVYAGTAEIDNYRKSTIYCQVKNINAVYIHKALMMWRQLWDLDLLQKLSKKYSECFWPQDEMVWVIQMSHVMSHEI